MNFIFEVCSNGISLSPLCKKENRKKISQDIFHPKIDVKEDLKQNVNLIIGKEEENEKKKHFSFSILTRITAKRQIAMRKLIHCLSKETFESEN